MWYNFVVTGKLVKLLYDAGSLLSQLRSPEHASTWLEQALAIVRTLQDGSSSSSSSEKLEAKILLTLGEVCIALGDYTNAVTINKDASVLFGNYIIPSLLLVLFLFPLPSNLTTYLSFLKPLHKCL